MNEYELNEREIAEIEIEVLRMEGESFSDLSNYYETLEYSNQDVSQEIKTSLMQEASYLFELNAI